MTEDPVTSSNPTNSVSLTQTVRLLLHCDGLQLDGAVGLPSSSSSSSVPNKPIWPSPLHLFIFFSSPPSPFLFFTCTPSNPVFITMSPTLPPPLLHRSAPQSPHLPLSLLPSIFISPSLLTPFTISTAPLRPLLSCHSLGFASGRQQLHQAPWSWTVHSSGPVEKCSGVKTSSISDFIQVMKHACL